MRNSFMCLWLAFYSFGCSEDAQKPIDIDTVEFSDGINLNDTPPFDFTGVELNNNPLPGEFGAPCTDNPECNSGYCLSVPGGKKCSMSCIDTCPTGYECKSTEGGDPIFLCTSIAQDEVCNGFDDDKNGLTDEGMCDDGNPCTTDGCDAGGNCTHFERDTQPCDDGSVCTEIDKCYGAICKGAKALVCFDGNVCTDDDGCDPISGCLFPFNSESCDDGNPCTVQDTCKGGACVVSKPRVCNDGNPCTTDSCNPTLGPTGCLFKAVTDGIAPIGEGGCAPTLPYCKGGKCSPVP